jgi:hypothetical protein
VDFTGQLKEKFWNTHKLAACLWETVLIWVGRKGKERKEGNETIHKRIAEIMWNGIAAADPIITGNYKEQELDTVPVH